MIQRIKKIEYIKKMAVFENFSWDENFLKKTDKQDKILEFKEINIFYGRNYSGKTTLSRIWRALEAGNVSDKYESPEFKLILTDGSELDHTSLNDHKLTVRVFNKDFINDNLHFISNHDQPIKSFAILGSENYHIEDKINKLKEQLGSKEEKTGLYNQLEMAENNEKSTKKKLDVLEGELRKKLYSKANSRDSGIKHNKLYGDPLYNVQKLEKDILCVANSNYKPLATKENENLSDLVKTDAKQIIHEIPAFPLNFDELAQHTKELVEKKISSAQSIQELLCDNDLQEWVRKGREIHESKRTNCGFCNRPMEQNDWNNLWEKLDKHFSDEYRLLENSIDNILNKIKSEEKSIEENIKIDISLFYPTQQERCIHLREKLEKHKKFYISSLQVLSNTLSNRKKNIFNPLQFVLPERYSNDLSSCQSDINELIREANYSTNNLSEKQKDAKEKLRLDNVYNFLIMIDYDEQKKKIDETNQECQKILQQKKEILNSIKNYNEQITLLKIQLKDEKRGADKVNELLNNFFGHKFLSLKAVANNLDSNNNAEYQFQVMRAGEKAYHLSEGECSLIAFCYFMAKLEDAETYDKTPIIWIDDPISSLDSNHIFFIYSLIFDQIKKEKHTQIFISTHNLEFLKYLKKLPKKKEDEKNIEYQYFMLERHEEHSIIHIMPSYLKNYVTEFNYLFHQIYKCAHANLNDDNYESIFYNFGNNARKFLEAFLYYKYPDGREKNEKLSLFFKNTSLTFPAINRIINEYSHLDGNLEKGMMPVDKPEIQKCARVILDTIQGNDETQYEALLSSIGDGVNNEPEKKISRIYNESETV